MQNVMKALRTVEKTFIEVRLDYGQAKKLFVDFGNDRLMITKMPTHV